MTGARVQYAAWLGVFALTIFGPALVDWMFQ